MNGLIQNEIAAIQRIGADRNGFGERIAHAFGYGGLDSEDRDFLFEIATDLDAPMGDGQFLVATIDIYTALGVPTTGFDVDVWEARKLHLSARATRENFKELSSICRGILSRYQVVFSDGKVVQIKEGVTS